jgi:sphingomyelin phosphodiesterase acid-like 3
MNTKYFLQLLIIYSILLTAFMGGNSTGNGYPKKIENYNGSTLYYDTTHLPASFLVISDIHLNSSASQNAAHGDTGDSLWMAAKKEIDTLIADKKPRFIIVLGDLPKHDDLTKGDSNNVRQNFEQVLTYFKDGANIPAGVPMVYVPGNNDSWNGDYSAFTLPDSIYRMYAYPFIHVDSVMAPDHACIANDSLQKSIGCFSMYPLGKANKLKVIVLNTVIFTKTRNSPYSPDPQRQSIDATTEINWLLTQLEQAAQNDEKVLLAMHVPPGIDGFAGTDMWNDKDIENIFLKAVEKYQNNITGLLACHTHMDGVRLLMDSTSHIDALLLSVAGIAPGHGNNPAMKFIEYSDSDYALKDFTEYYMNYWNADGTGTLRDWDSSFSFGRIASGYDFSSMTMLTWFQKNNKENIDKLVYSIYTDKSKKPEKSSFINEINSSIYVGYRK